MSATLDREVPDYKYMRAYASMAGMPFHELDTLIDKAIATGAPERAVKWNELLSEWVTVDELPDLTKRYVISLVDDNGL